MRKTATLWEHFTGNWWATKSIHTYVSEPRVDNGALAPKFITSPELSFKILNPVKPLCQTPQTWVLSYAPVTEVLYVIQIEWYLASSELGVYRVWRTLEASSQLSCEILCATAGLTISTRGQRDSICCQWRQCQFLCHSSRHWNNTVEWCKVVKWLYIHCLSSYLIGITGQQLLCGGHTKATAGWESVDNAHN